MEGRALHFGCTWWWVGREDAYLLSSLCNHLLYLSRDHAFYLSYLDVLASDLIPTISLSRSWAPVHLSRLSLAPLHFSVPPLIVLRHCILSHFGVTTGSSLCPPLPTVTMVALGEGSALASGSCTTGGIDDNRGWSTREIPCYGILQVQWTDPRHKSILSI